MKKIIFIRSNPVMPDIRVEREVNYLSGHYKIHILAWDRERKVQSIEKRNNFIVYRYQGKGRYGGGLKNIIPIFKWWYYEFKWLMRQKYDIIHACDFDTYLPALLVAKSKHKVIVYDIFDFYSDMILNIPHIIKKIIRKIDIFLMQFADGVIIADDSRREQIRGAKPKKLLTIYNTPNNHFEVSTNFTLNTEENKYFVLGYIGVLKKERGLDLAIEVVKKMWDVKLIIGGYGPYENYFKEKMQNIKNITFIGKVYPHERAVDILSKCDALFALYNPKIPNHKYSSPNKLFEAMMLEKPIIVTKNTGMDNKVEKYKCGIAVDLNNEDQLRAAIIELKNMKEKNNNFYGLNGRKAYNEIFSPHIMQKKIINFYNNFHCSKNNKNK